MGKTMTPSQVNKAVSNYRALLEKHAGEFDSVAVQAVLGQSELASEMFGLFRARVEAQSNMVVRHVRVDRSRSPQQMLDATGRAQYTDKKVVAEMPRGEGDEVDVYFFPCKRYTLVGEVAKMLDERGLKIDVYAQAAVNEADPAFADDHPNGCQWQDAHGEFCYATFYRWLDERRVGVCRVGNDWFVNWWFAGVRK